MSGRRRRETPPIPDLNGTVKMTRRPLQPFPTILQLAAFGAAFFVAGFLLVALVLTVR
jgi:hypothetical protein